MKIPNNQEENTFFDCLLEKAIGEWPKKIDLSSIKYADEELNRFTVIGLDLLSEKIGSRHIGKPNEVIMVNLHEAITTVVHKVARFCTRVEIRNIRKEWIKKDFENRLFNALNDKDLGWEKEDIELIQEYFAKSSSTD